MNSKWSWILNENRGTLTGTDRFSSFSSKTFLQRTIFGHAPRKYGKKTHKKNKKSSNKFEGTDRNPRSGHLRTRKISLGIILELISGKKKSECSE